MKTIMTMKVVITWTASDLELGMSKKYRGGVLYAASFLSKVLLASVLLGQCGCSSLDQLSHGLA